MIIFTFFQIIFCTLHNNNIYLILVWIKIIIIKAQLTYAVILKMTAIILFISQRIARDDVYIIIYNIKNIRHILTKKITIENMSAETKRN